MGHFTPIVQQIMNHTPCSMWGKLPPHMLLAACCPFGCWMVLSAAAGTDHQGDPDSSYERHPCLTWQKVHINNRILWIKELQPLSVRLIHIKQANVWNRLQQEGKWEKGDNDNTKLGEKLEWQCHARKLPAGPSPDLRGGGAILRGLVVWTHTCWLFPVSCSDMFYFSVA